MTAPLVRAEVRYVGRVQGVGFRWRAATVAAPFAVSGHVRNLRDGSVEVVAEGTSAAVESFLAVVARRMGSCIEGEQLVWTAPRGDRKSFDIVR